MSEEAKEVEVVGIEGKAAQVLAIVQEELPEVITNAHSLVVASNADLEAAREVRLDIKKRSKDYVERWREIKSSAKETHSNICTAEKSCLNPLEEADEIIKGKMTSYIEVENARVAEENRLAQEESDKKHQAFLKRAEARINTLMERGADNAEKIATLTKELDREDITEDEAGMVQSQIEVLEGKITADAKAAADKARQAEAKKHAPPVTPITASKPKVMTRKETFVTILDPKKLLQAVIDGKVPLRAVEPKKGVLKSLATNGVELPGCNVEIKDVPLNR